MPGKRNGQAAKPATSFTPWGDREEQAVTASSGGPPGSRRAAPLGFVWRQGGRRRREGTFDHRPPNLFRRASASSGRPCLLSKSARFLATVPVSESLRPGSLSSISSALLDRGSACPRRP